MAESTTDLLSRLRRRHRDYDGPLGCGWWRLARDAYQGTGGFRVAVAAATDDRWGDGDRENASAAPTAGSYLVRYPRERGDRFAARQRVSRYANFTQPILDEYRGHLWRRAPQRDPGTDPEVARLWADVDGQGTGIDAWLEAATQPAQLLGWVPVLVDRSRGDVPLTAARTYARRLDPEELVDWELDGQGRFRWARLGTTATERDPFDGTEVTRETYTTWTATEWESIEIVTRDGGEPTIEDRTREAHGLGRVPLAVLHWTPPVERGRLYGQSQADGIVAASLEHFNVSSERREHERGQLFAILCVQSHDPEALQKIKLGVHNGIVAEPDMAMPQFIAPPEGLATYSSERLDALVDEIWTQAHLQRPSAQPVAESGVARQWRFGQTRSVLVGATKRLAAFERDLLDLALRWAHPDDAAARAEGLASARVAYPEDFDVDDLLTVLESRLTALEKGDRLVPEIRREARMAIGRTLNPTATPTERARLEAQVERLAAFEATQFERATDVQQSTAAAATAAAIASLPPATAAGPDAIVPVVAPPDETTHVEPEEA